MKRVLIFLITITTSLLFVSCSSRTNLNEMFNAFETETTEKIPYVCYDALKFNDETLDFNELLHAKGYDAIFNEVYVVQDDVVWFGYSDSERNENGAKIWNIASVCMNGADMNIAYSGEFCLTSDADQVYAQKNNIHTDKRYLEANGFYYDGKIVLTDHVKVVEFDLTTKKSMEFSSKNYEFPILPIETRIIDHQAITFCKNSEQKSFNIENGIKTSEAFEKLYKLEKEENWQGKSYLSELFNKVQIANDQIYIICRVLNWDGETHALVFQYDFENNSCKYVFHCFMGDVISNNLYIVPTI